MELMIIGLIGALLVVLLVGVVIMLRQRSKPKAAPLRAPKSKSSGQKGQSKATSAAAAPANSAAAPANSAAAPANSAAAQLAQAPTQAEEKPVSTPAIAPTQSETMPSFSHVKPDIAPDTANKIRILVVDDNQETSGHVERLLYFEDDMVVVGQAVNGRLGVEKAIETQPHIILMDINMPDMDGITATSHLSEQVPFSQVIMISVQSDPEYMKQAMLAGARDFQPKPFSADELVEAIRRIYEASQSVYEQFSPEREQQQEAALPDQTQMRRSDQPGRVIAVYSPKGGVGTTTIAANLAAVLQHNQGNVVLVDADLQFGDIQVHLNVQDDRSIADMVRADEFAVDLLPQVLVPHETGLHLLLAPAQPERAELVSAEMLGQAIDALRERFDIVVVDVQTLLSNQTLSALECADYILLVTVPELASVKNVKLFLDVTVELSFGAKRIGLAINSADKEGAIEAKQIQQALKLANYYQVPHDLKIATAINNGKVITQKNVSPPFAQGLAKMAKAVHEELQQLTAMAEDAVAEAV